MPPKFNLFFLKPANLIGPSLKWKWNFKGNQTISFYYEVESSSPLAQKYRWKEDNITKAYGIKVSCYGEHVGEYIRNLGNIMGSSHWELKGNTVRTYWEPREKWKKILPTPNLKGKKAKHLGCLLGPSHWLQKFLFPKEFVTIFGLG